jgi:hypothetical protein
MGDYRRSLKMSLDAKIVLLNGARMCGKGVVVDHLRSAGYLLTPAECKETLHYLTMTMFAVPEQRYWEIYNDRSLKEVPLPEFRINLGEDRDDLEDVLGYYLDHWECGWRDKEFNKLNLSVREAMIYVSEVICKPRFGEDFFGVSRAAKLKEGFFYIDDSCGFVEELPPLIDRVGQENILLIRIHRDGCTFEGDSRQMIPDGVIANTFDVYNNGSLEDYFKKMESIVGGFLYA